MRVLIIILMLVISLAFYSQGQNRIVADADSHIPLSNASVFNHKGTLIGYSSSDGKMPFTERSDYPVTIRFLGYKELSVQENNTDTIFMQESVMELPEFVVESRSRNNLHILAYVREYSTMTSYSDTIFMFREKCVDFMLPQKRKKSFKGWQIPRVLTSKSYFQFTGSQATDSVSDACDYHFSWSDWVGILPEINIPLSIAGSEQRTDTVYGKYSPTEIWTKDKDMLTIEVDVLADTMSRKWVPSLSTFFNDNLDFDLFKLRFNYADNNNTTLSSLDLLSYSYVIESTGRGREMFMFNNNNPSFFVRTYAEVYILDKSFIKESEAKKWERRQLTPAPVRSYKADIPALSPEIVSLIDRVNNIDKDAIRLEVTPDHRLGSFKEKKKSGQSLLKRLKSMIRF